jgi:hypothetical protein
LGDRLGDSGTLIRFWPRETMFLLQWFAFMTQKPSGCSGVRLWFSESIRACFERHHCHAADVTSGSHQGLRAAGRVH